MSGVAGGGRRFENRRARRVPVTVPVEIEHEAGKSGGVVSRLVGESRDVSADGMYVTISGRGRFISGDVLRVSVSIPWESRRVVPFTRILGLCRVVRTEDLSTKDWIQQGLAVSFCEDQVSMLGTMSA